MPSSVIVKAFQRNNAPNLYVLNYRAITGMPLYFEIEPPYTNITPGSILEQYKVSSYTLSIGNTNITTANSIITATINEPGTYPLQLSVEFEGAGTATYSYTDSIVIYNKWPEYDYTKTTVLDESKLYLPHTLEETSLKPNEFGVADVVNASILKLNECLKYLKKRSTVMYNKTPTQYIGWLGVHAVYPEADAVWYTTTDRKNLSKDFINSKQLNPISFNSITDIKIIGNELYIADKTSSGEPCITFGYLSKRYTRILFSGLLPFLSQVKTISAIEVYVAEPSTRFMYILDKLTNKIFKITILLNNTEDYIVSHVSHVYLDQVVGGFGDRESASKFYSPNALHCKDNFLYVVDTNNQCIKKYSLNLGWVKTYYQSDFLDNQPIDIVVNTQKTVNNIQHPSLLYVLTKTNKIYILNQDGSYFDDSAPYIQLKYDSVPVKIVLDAAEEFFYIVYDTFVVKYSILGLFVNVVDEISTTSTFTAGCADLYHNVYIADKNKIFKFLDIVEDFSIINNATDSLYWADSDLYIEEDEFVQDWAINKSLKRIAQNVDIFRKSIHSKFGILNVYNSSQLITYYTALPVSTVYTVECAAESLKDALVGVNELTFSQIFNRGVEKIYKCIDSLKEFINTTYLTQEEGGINCDEKFCWSWKNTKCSALTLPSMQICNVNPVTFAELRSTNTFTYAPSVLWRDAISDCCKKD